MFLSFRRMALILLRFLPTLLLLEHHSRSSRNSYTVEFSFDCAHRINNFQNDYSS
jgi:hypothetical protein